MVGGGGGGDPSKLLANPSCHGEEHLEKLIVTQLLSGYLPAFVDSDGSQWPGVSPRRELRPIFVSHFFLSENESSSSSSAAAAALSYSYSRTLVACFGPSDIWKDSCPPTLSQLDVTTKAKGALDIWKLCLAQCLQNLWLRN
jgi:hypothetical protein